MTQPLNPNAAAWVAALRSGEYKQGKTLLHDIATNERCCLGVACDLYIKAGHALEVTTSPSGRAAVYAGSINMLPSAVRDWIGLQSNAGKYQSEALWSDNDDGKTFLEIADLIESQPEGLFVAPTEAQA